MIKGSVLSVSAPQSIPIEDKEKLQKYMEENKNEERFIVGLNEFTNASMSLVLSDAKENVAYSPLSLYFALAMVAEGADGSTRQQLFKTLGVEDYSNEDFAKEIGKLYRKNYYNAEDQVCTIANSIWMDQGIAFEDDYIHCIRDDFYAELFVDELGDQTNWENISKWINQKTNGMLQPNIQLSEESMMALINTI